MPHVDLPYRWTTVGYTIRDNFPSAIWRRAPGDVWAVAADTIQHWDGHGWRDSPHPASHALDSIWGSGPSDIWAVSSYSDILHFDGSLWTRSASPVVAQFASVWGTGPADVWAIAPDVVIHFDGKSWSVQTLPEVVAPAAISGTSPTDIWLLGSAAPAPYLRVYHFDGKSWSRMAFPGSAADYAHALLPLSPTNVWVGDGDGGLWRWDGTSWSTQNRPWPTITSPLNHLWAIGPNDIWATGTDHMAHYDGSSWQLFPVDDSTPIPYVMSGVAGDVWAVSYLKGARFGDAFLIQRWNGTAWVTDIPLGGTQLFSAHVTGSGPHDVWVASGGAVAHWDGTALNLVAGATGPGIWMDGHGEVWAAGLYGAFRWDGKQFNRFANRVGADPWTAIWGSSTSDMLLLGSPVLHFDGTTLQSVLGSPVRLPSAMWGSASDAWLGCGGYLTQSGGAHGSLFHWDGTKLSGPTVYNYHVNGLWGSASNDVWAVGESSNLLHFDGASWSTLNLSVQVALYGVAGTASSDVWAVGAQGTVLHFDGHGWSQVDAPNVDMLDVWASGPGDVWMTTGNQLIHFGL